MRFSDDAISIKTAICKAEDGHVESYLALTDSIVGVIKCCPTSLTRNADSSPNQDLLDALKNV